MDSITEVFYHLNKMLIATKHIAHLLAMSYVSQNVLQAGSAAAAMPSRNMTIYSILSASHMFLQWWQRLSPLSDEAHSLIAESAEEPLFAQPIRRKLHSCTDTFSW